MYIPSLLFIYQGAIMAKRVKDDFAKNKLLNLINYCNTQIYSSTDYMIAKAILNLVENNQTTTLEELAKEASVSETSVHKFIKKVGFKNFDEFRMVFFLAIDQMNTGRNLMHMHDHGKIESFDQLVTSIYSRAQANMIETVKLIDFYQLKQVVDQLLSANTVTFIGDEHTLSDFYTLQLDLLGMLVPSYLFKRTDIQIDHMSRLKEGDVIIYLNVFKGWFSKTERESMKIAHDNKATTIGFFQEIDNEINELFDQVVLYGIKDSHNQGFYSMYFLSQILSEMIYEHK